MRASTLKVSLSSSIFQQRTYLTLPLVATAIALLVYLFTVVPDITWQSYGGDGGELIAASYTLGIPHPPGYPTYIILGKIFSLIPFGTVAGRYNIFSSLATALAVGFVSLSALQLGGSARGRFGTTSQLTIASVACGLTLAFIPLVWSQASIAEVYALNLAVLAVFLWALISGGPPILIGFMLGLSLTTHLTSGLMIPMTLIVISKSSWPKLALGMIIGLIPYLLLFSLAAGNSPVIWGEADSVQGWWWLVSAKLYHPNTLALPLDQWKHRLFLWGPTTLLPILLMAITSTFAIRNHRATPKNVAAILMIVTSGAYVLYAFLHATNDAIVLTMPAFLLLSITLVSTMKQLGKLSLAFPTALVLLGILFLHSHADARVRFITKQELQSIPEDAIVITPGDQSIASLWYFQSVEDWRPDLTVVDGNMFQFDWYRNRLEKNYPDLVSLSNDDLPSFFKNNLHGRPVCQISLVTPANNACHIPDAQ